MVSINTSYQASSNNFGNRKGQKIDMLVMHSTETDSFESALRELTIGDRHVSAHYLIDRDGTIYCLVPEDKKANHAGESRWQLATGEEVENINARSIGIEFQCKTGQEFTPEQIESGLKLSKQITQKYNIDPHNVVAHSDIAPDRKSDPAANFPWELFAHAGIAENGARRGGGEVTTAQLCSKEYAFMEQLARDLKEKKEQQAAEFAFAKEAAKNAPKEEKTQGNLLTGLAQAGMMYGKGNLRLAFLGLALIGKYAEGEATAESTPEKTTEQPTTNSTNNTLSQVASGIADSFADRISQNPLLNGKIL